MNRPLLQKLVADRFKGVSKQDKKQIGYNLTRTNSKLLEFLQTPVPLTYKQKNTAVSQLPIKFPANFKRTNKNITDFLNQFNKKKEQTFLTEIKQEVLNKQIKKQKILFNRVLFEVENILDINDKKRVIDFVVSRNKKNKPFSVSFTSSIVNNISFRHQFRSTEHFKSWIGKIIETHEDTSGNITMFIPENFRTVKLEVSIMKGGCLRTRRDDMEIKNKRCIYKLLDPMARENNCGLACIRELLEITNELCINEGIKPITVPSCLAIRKKYKLTVNQMVSVDKLLIIHKDYMKEYNNEKINRCVLKIITYDYEIRGNHYELIKNYTGKLCRNDFVFFNECHYLYFDEKHYSIITAITPRKKKEQRDEDKRINRSILAYDIETRLTEDFICYKSSYPEDSNEVESGYNTVATHCNRTGIYERKKYIIKDVILEAAWKGHKGKEFIRLSLKTNNERSSCRQFLDWLIFEDGQHRNYRILAHNGSNFDFIVLCAEMTENEFRVAEPFLKGLSILTFKFHNHLFIDSSRHLSSSLESLCKGYKIKEAKLTEFVVGGKIVSNTELCFYKKELTFNEFLDLETSEPEYWKLYKDYCYRDCTSLLDIWKTYSDQINVIVKKLAPLLPYNQKVKTQPILLCNTATKTISGLCIRIFRCIYKTIPDSKDIRLFMDFKKGKGDEEKYKFILKQKRGGISHNNKSVKVKGCISVDETSQYPAAQVHCRIPCGESNWYSTYEPEMYGYYHITNLVFEEGSAAFKPIANIEKSGVLNWKTGNDINDDVYVDSWMLKYLMIRCGLKTFSVSKALLSDNFVYGEDISGIYVNTLFNDKLEQDRINDEENKNNINVEERVYNKPYREVIKLGLNAVPGKFVENTEHYSNKIFSYNNTKKTIGDVNIDEYGEGRDNEFLMLGVAVYSHSKQNLFEYLKCLPHNPDSSLQVETDSIYMPKKDYLQFEENVNNYVTDDRLGDVKYVVKFGNDLANIKVEVDTEEWCYFLKKKLYYCDMGDNQKDIKVKVKGIPARTITPDGTHVALLYSKNENGTYDNIITRKLFEDLSTNISHEIKYSSLIKNIYGKLNISTSYKTRLIRGLENVEILE